MIDSPCQRFIQANPSFNTRTPLTCACSALTPLAVLVGVCRPIGVWRESESSQHQGDPHSDTAQTFHPTRLYTPYVTILFSCPRVSLFPVCPLCVCPTVHSADDSVQR